MIGGLIILACMASWVPILCALLYLQIGQTRYWRQKFETLEAETKTLFHGHVDATFHRLNGQPLYSKRDEPQHPGFSYTLGHDRIEQARQADLLTMGPPEGLTIEDIEMLNKIDSGSTN